MNINILNNNKSKDSILNSLETLDIDNIKISENNNLLNKKIINQNIDINNLFKDVNNNNLSMSFLDSINKLINDEMN